MCLKVSFSGLSLALMLSCCAQQEVKLPGIATPLQWHNQPLRFSVENAVLTITAGPQTDMFRDPQATYNTDNAPKLLFAPDEDFVLSTAVSHAFASKWDAGGLVLIGDSLNWVKFCFEKDYTGARRIVSVVTRGISDDANSVALDSDQVYLRLAKAGKVITLYYSSDGRMWTLVRHFQLATQPGFRIGFLAQSPTGEQCEVRFSDIRYEARKITDPYFQGPD